MRQSVNNLALKSNDTVNNPLRLIPPGKKSVFQKIAISGMGETRFIAFADIVYCQSVNNYTNVFTRQGSSLTCCKTLKDIEAKLPEDLFIRIHASFLVNIQDITALKRRQNWEVEINNKQLLPVSRLKKETLLVTLDC